MKDATGMRILIGRHAWVLWVVVLCAGGGLWLAAQERQMGGVGLTVYTDPNFRGRNATFRNDVPNLQSYSGLNDRISSLEVGFGEMWEVCEHANYLGRCQVFSGTEQDLRQRGWNDMMSSVRRVGSGGGGARPPVRPPIFPPVQPGLFGLEVFSNTGFSGDRRTLNSAVSDFRSINFNDRTMSLRVAPGQSWEICADAQFRACRVVNSDWSNLNDFGLSRRISSARPWSQGGGGLFPPPGGGNLRLVLFDNTGFRGRSYTVTGVTPVLSSFMNRAESVRVDGGVWELCEWPQFGGRCVNVSSSLSDLRSVGLLNRVASVRPTMMPR